VRDNVVGKPSTWRSTSTHKSIPKPEEAPDAVEKLDENIKQRFEVQETKGFVRGVRGDEEVREAETLLGELEISKLEEVVVEEEDDPIAQEEQFLVAEYVSSYPFP
jgi:hypothetical protein